MKITYMAYSTSYMEEFVNLPLKIQKKAIKAQKLFLKEPFTNSLRLHKLKGNLDNYWSISIDKNYRAIFRVINGRIAHFTSIGTHAIYDS